MKKFKTMQKGSSVACVAVLFVSCCATIASAQTVVYNGIPTQLPGNVASKGFQCCATSEFGDKVALAGAARVGGFATVVMSSWAKHSDYPAMNAAGFIHPITLAVYDNAASAAAHQPLWSVTQNFLIPWRPEADAACGTAWKSPLDGKCYNGMAFTIKFDLRTAGPGGTAVSLPSPLIYGIAFNTNTWGYSPLGVGGPYESLNVGLNTALPSVGTDVDPVTVFWNTSSGPFYADGGAAGTGFFRPDSHGDWDLYRPAVQFMAFTFATTADSCKNDGWQNLVRQDFTSFKNQGDCVSYSKNGK